MLWLQYYFAISTYISNTCLNVYFRKQNDLVSIKNVQKFGSNLIRFEYALYLNVIHSCVYDFHSTHLLTLKSEQYELLFGFCNLVLMILRLLITIWIVTLHRISQTIIAFLKLVKDNFQNNAFDNIVNVFDSTRMLIEKKKYVKHTKKVEIFLSGGSSLLIVSFVPLITNNVKCKEPVDIFYNSCWLCERFCC